MVNILFRLCTAQTFLVRSACIYLRLDFVLEYFLWIGSEPKDRIWENIMGWTQNTCLHHLSQTNSPRPPRSCSSHWELRVCPCWASLHNCYMKKVGKTRWKITFIYVIFHHSLMKRQQSILKWGRKLRRTLIPLGSTLKVIEISIIEGHLHP